MSTETETERDRKSDEEAATDETTNTATDTPDEAGSEPLLSIEDLEVHFDAGGLVRKLLSDTKVRAVDGVNLELEEKDIVVLVGESGCGKTTLGKSAVGLQKPTGGSVSYRGQDIWEAKDSPRSSDIDWAEIRRALQIIHQDPSTALNSSRRVEAILADPLKKWRTELSAEERKETIYRYLEYVDMVPAEDYANRYPHQLSGGEKQRIVLGRALLMNPDVILADEAISALDVSLRVEMMELILDLQETFDTSYLFISHDLANARYLAKRAGGRIAIMYLGEIVEIGSPDEILKNPTHPYTKVLRWSTPSIDPEIAAEEIETQPPIRRIDVPDPADPPSGCKFHTRCPEAREACTQMEPELYDAEGGTKANCFRAVSNHEYWSSPELEDEDEIGDWG
ncbi:ABC transporter ATP-binding protein [Natronoglomus mannanivorans]|uniref:ABC transporter ATP-binding protein n=1 Tax=Natronoglomus mannanivorans TaxID=2979990 RepID=UPI0030830310